MAPKTHPISPENDPKRGTVRRVVRRVYIYIYIIYIYIPVYIYIYIQKHTAFLYKRYVRRLVVRRIFGRHLGSKPFRIHWAHQGVFEGYAPGDVRQQIKTD